MSVPTSTPQLTGLVKIPIPCSGDDPRYLTIGNKIKLGRFDSVTWNVCFGWYSVNGNRKVLGVYLACTDTGVIRALQEPDLIDIYLIEY